MNKWATVALLVISSMAYAGNDSDKTKETTKSEKPESNQPESSSTFDRVVDTIAEAAKSNPDYGKDIGDR